MNRREKKSSYFNCMCVFLLLFQSFGRALTTHLKRPKRITEASMYIWNEYAYSHILRIYNAKVSPNQYGVSVHHQRMFMLVYVKEYIPVYTFWLLYVYVCQFAWDSRSARRSVEAYNKYAHTIIARKRW